MWRVQGFVGRGERIVNVGEIPVLLPSVLLLNYLMKSALNMMFVTNINWLVRTRLIHSK